VRARRLLATVAIQGLQRMLHRVVMRPVMEGRLAGPPRPLVALVRRVPVLSYLPARLIGLGLRPEHAPAFARR
jgi:hypothetical protein